MGDERIVLERILNRDDKPTDLPLALLKHITNDFSEERKIGQGGFGAVYKGLLRNGIIVAVKRIDVNIFTIDDVSFRREINSMMKINHENVVRFLGFCSNTHHISLQEAGSSAVDFVNIRERLLCLEYISNGSLDKHITDELRGLEWETRYDIITGICKGLCHLKEKNIIHMDLKPQNILLDDHMVPKITDFGLSRPNENSRTMGQRFGTRGYFAPEYETFGKTSFECDIYSLGVIIAELITGCKGIPDKDNVLESWKRRESNPPMTFLQYQQLTSCIEIAVRCREQEPEDRPPICVIMSILSESDSRDGRTDGMAKKRQIVESASGKGPLGSIQKAEASLLGYMDINSSAQGHFTGQAEHCNLHPLQSFSRHYPTNKTYLGEESRAVDVARGAMGSLLDKLGKLVKEDYNLERNVKRDIESFSEDLAIIHNYIPNLEKLDGFKIWLDEVREMSYNIEDTVDSFLVYVKPNSTGSGFKELLHEGLKFLDNDMMTHHQIGDVIKDIKNQVQTVVDRQKKYIFSVNNVIAKATIKAPTDPRVGIYINKGQLIGIKAQTDEVISLFEKDGDVSMEELKIVSIVGLGGLGKTTLAKEVYGKLKAQYNSKAFISVGQNPDVKKVLMNILSAFERKFNTSNLNLEVQQLIDELQEFLENKRYLIVIDDIWDSAAWGLIQSAFPENNLGSRMITTTRIHRIALASCNAESKFVYRMKPLSDENSRTLFLSRIFGPGKDCPGVLKDISTDILKRCGGMPLAIISIASLLAGEPVSTWDYVRKSLVAMTECDGLEKMKQILDLSYIHLPDHLKTCLLYVCMYPEDREIYKIDLLRQWVAEGFVHVSRNGGLDAEDVAENYLKELINMCMIQPEEMDYNDEVLSCRVHDIIIDLMRSKSKKENFTHIIDGPEAVTGAYGQIRRLSVQYNGKVHRRMLETINITSLSHVRSVSLYRGSFVASFLDFKYVRVLHIEHEGAVDLTGVNRLFLLRYLKVASISGGGYGVQLPNQIGELQQLETIDLGGGVLKSCPSDIVSLPRLSHLRCGTKYAGIVLPDGIERLKSLRTLEGVNVPESSVENIKALSKLINLSTLHFGTGSMLSPDVTAAQRNALHSSITTLAASLKILTLGANSDYIEDVFTPAWSSRALFTIRELDLLGCNFKRCPGWIGQFYHLHKLRILVWEVDDAVSIVKGLPSLAYFWLESRLIKLPFFPYWKPARRGKERVVIPGGGAFQTLKHLNFRCPMLSLAFEAKAMPKLEKLHIWFPYYMSPQLLPVGIKHLPAPNLKQISLHMSCKYLVPNGKNQMDIADFGPAIRSYDYKVNHRQYERKDNDRQHRAYVRHLFKGAFKQHHSAAGIVIHFDDDFDYINGNDGGGAIV